MNEKIRNHVKKYNEANGWGSSDEDIIETIKESNIVYRGDPSEHRWWTEWFYVVEIDGMLIGFCNATSDGDMSAWERGYEFNPDSICEVEKKTKTVTYYEPIKE